MPSAKTVLITGGSRGVGSALAKRLAGEGWTVFATARDPNDVPTASGGNGTVIPVALELTDEVSIAAAAARVHERAGEHGLDALVNNAGIIVQGPMELVPAHELRRQFEVNVLGPMAVIQTLLPLLRAAHGRIVNVGAPTGWVGVPLLGPIGASKAALHLINDALRLELRDQGISVSLIVPGAMETEIFATAEAAAKAAGPSSPEAERVYAKLVHTAVEKMADMKLAPVDPTVNAIHRALTARYPKAAYTVGRDARQFVFLRRLPRAVRDRALAGAIGVSRQMFDEEPVKINRALIAP